MKVVCENLKFNIYNYSILSFDSIVNFDCIVNFDSIVNFD